MTRAYRFSSTLIYAIDRELSALNSFSPASNHWPPVIDSELQSQITNYGFLPLEFRGASGQY
jgi:hypothetical protein